MQGSPSDAALLLLLLSLALGTPALTTERVTMPPTTLKTTERVTMPPTTVRTTERVTMPPTTIRTTERVTPMTTTVGIITTERVTPPPVTTERLTLPPMIAPCSSVLTCDEDPFQSHPSDCSKFIDCRQRGDPLVWTCGRGLHFSQEKLRCMTPHLANCLLCDPLL